MNIIFYGGKQAGATCLLALLANREKVVCVVPVDDAVEGLAKEFGLKILKPASINSEENERLFRSMRPDLLVCAHGRQIIGSNILRIPKKGCINLHPCLYKYKGAHPIERLLADKGTKASVGVHKMIEKVDAGAVIDEVFVDVSECKTVVEVYNRLYPVYAIALKRALGKLAAGL